MRPATDDDAELLVAWHADPEVSRYWDDETFTRDEVLERLHREPVDAWIVETGGEAVGYLQSWWEDDPPRRGGLDGFLVPPARRRGLMPDAARALAQSLIDAGWESRHGRSLRVERARGPGLDEGGLRGGLPSRGRRRASRRVGVDALRSPLTSSTAEMADDGTVYVRYLIDDVDAAADFYVSQLGFEVVWSAGAAFAEIARGNLHLLLSGPSSSAARPMPDGRQPEPGGWNRIHLIVDDIASEVERLRAAGINFRSEIVRGPGGSQIVFDDPSGNPVELFQSS